MEASAPELIVRGAVIGVAGVIGLAIARGEAGFWTRASGLAFAVGVMAYAVDGLDGRVPWPIELAAHLTVGGLWPFAVLLFGAPRPWIASPVALLAPVTLFVTLYVLAHGPLAGWHDGIVQVQNAGEAATAIGVIAVVWRGTAGDLDPLRRHLRGPFMALVGAYALSLAILDTLSVGGVIGWNTLPDALALLALSLLGATIFTAGRPGLLATASGTPKAADTDEDAARLARLNAVMVGEEAWREEGLTIGSLAERVGLAEHSLRPLINGQLGHRNFAAYVNGHRLDEAKRRLGDPAEAGTTIAQIAYESGFGSLGAFGRAFKADTGRTPSAWRNAVMAGDKPISKTLADSEGGDRPSSIGEPSTPG